MCCIHEAAAAPEGSLFFLARLTLQIFSEKIRAGQAAKRHPDFMIVARLEALIAGWGEEEARQALTPDASPRRGTWSSVLRSAAGAGVWVC